VARLKSRAVLAALLGVLASTTWAPATSAATGGFPQTACGDWRWAVKTGADASRLKVDRHAVTVTVRYLRTRPKPSAYPQDRRIRPTELHTFQIDRVRLVAFKEEDDSDYHLIIKDSAGRTIITEIPAPRCVRAISPWRTDIASVRSYFNHHYAVTRYWKDAHATIDIRGLGFFDELHGQAGVAPNGIELHPVIWMKILPAPGPWCRARAAYANDGYPGDYYVYIHSNRPDTKATARDAGDKWSRYTNESGYARILLYYTHSGEKIYVTVGKAKCSTTA
jgi:hypothetical protein